MAMLSSWNFLGDPLDRHRLLIGRDPEHPAVVALDGVVEEIFIVDPD